MNILDRIEVRNRQGAALSDPDYSVFHDIERRGSVDTIDLYTVPQHAFTTLPEHPTFPTATQAATVPEPSSSVMAAAAVAVALTWRRARRGNPANGQCRANVNAASCGVGH